MDTEIRVSTESRPWRRKFSRRSYRDLNPGPFSPESCAITTELSPSPDNAGISLVVTVYNDRYIISLFPFSPSLIRFVVSVCVKHHVYLFALCKIGVRFAC